MAKLEIGLRDGFQDDEVVVRVNEQEVFHDRVRTDAAISFAGRVQVDVPEGAASIFVSVPARNASAAMSVQPSATPYVAVFLRGRHLELRKLAEPMPLM